MLTVIRIILSPFALLYWCVIRVRNYLFNTGIFKSKQIESTIVSIGNITVGGSGKTPTVLYVANLLKQTGKNIGILSRGYGRKTKNYLLVSKEDGPEVKVEECGDEMYLVSDELRTPSAVCENRVVGANRLINDTGVNGIVLDDAYQHRWIKRDLDILIYDQRFLNKVGNLDQNMIPLGLMREPFSSTDRADIVLINRKFSKKKEIPDKLKHYFEDKKVFWGYYEATGIYDLKTHHFYNLDDFHGDKSLVICGIARPYSFLKILEEHNIDIRNKILFPDHKHYTHKEIQAIRKKFYETNSYSVLTTQKDAVKLTEFAKELDDIEIYYIKIELKIEKKDEFDKEILSIFKG